MGGGKGGGEDGVLGSLGRDRRCKGFRARRCFRSIVGGRGRTFFGFLFFFFFFGGGGGEDGEGKFEDVGCRKWRKGGLDRLGFRSEGALSGKILEENTDGGDYLEMMKRCDGGSWTL